MTRLFHITTHPALKSPIIGQEFTLVPGGQCAEGIGVYFSEGQPVSLSTAEGTRQSEPTGIVVIEVDSPSDWWRSKASKAKKFGKPRTWHTAGRDLPLTIRSVQDNYIHCTING